MAGGGQLGDAKLAGRADTARVSRTGTVTVPGLLLACPSGGGTCTVNASIQTSTRLASAARARAHRDAVAVLGSRTFTVRAGRHSTITVHLTRAALRTLSRDRRLRVTVAVSVRAADGKTRSIRRSFLLLARPAAHHRAVVHHHGFLPLFTG